MNHDKIVKQLSEQLIVAMMKRPSNTILETINESLELVYPTRKEIPYPYTDEKCCYEKWNLTNNDIIKALKRFNEVY
jgi:hypothetical protein